MVFGEPEFELVDGQLPLGCCVWISASENVFGCFIVFVTSWAFAVSLVETLEFHMTNSAVTSRVFDDASFFACWDTIESASHCRPVN